MLESLATFKDTLAYLAPGFVLMKVFYVFGLSTKRSDAQWAIWSVIAAWIPYEFSLRFVPVDLRQPASFAIAIILGVVVAVVWHALADRYPKVRADQSIRAWDLVLSRPRWVQVDLTDGRTFLGYVRNASASIDADDEVDLYIGTPKRIEEGKPPIELPNVEGILVRSDHISSIAVFTPQPTKS